MTEPVDTGALRTLANNLRSIARGDHALGIPLDGKMHDSTAERVEAAADEVDRLRAEMVKAIREIRASSSEAQFERERAEGYEREMSAMYAVVENAPHGDRCRTRGWYDRGTSAFQVGPCTCWKADVL